MQNPITQLNDMFRKTFLGGRVVVTRGIAALPEADQAAIIAKVRAFDNFTPENDPYGEHDFGAIDDPAAGRIFWKIDYYAPDMEHGSENPADASQTVRVLTVMLASEY